jgi:chromosome partitioning protein
MRKIGLFNQKGGVGKTTVTLILAQLFARRGLQTVLLDNDPQGSATQWLLNDPHHEAEARDAFQRLPEHNIHRLLQERCTLADALLPIQQNLRLLGASTSYEQAKNEFAEVPGKDALLRFALEDLDCDVLLIDTPGEVSQISSWALALIDTVVIPVNTSMLAIDSLNISLQRIQQAKRLLNPNLQRIVVVPNLTKNRNTSKFSIEMLREQYHDYLAYTPTGELVVLDDRAEVENLISAYAWLPNHSKSLEQFTTLQEVLR